MFDASKEHIAILHPVHGHGNDFKLLGSMIDVKLTMHTAVTSIMKKAAPKKKALLRTRGLYTAADMLRQYKTHLWSYIEYPTGVVRMAAPSTQSHPATIYGRIPHD